MGELWCFTNLEHLENSDFLQQRNTWSFSRTVYNHGTWWHNSLSKNWAHKFNHFLKCFVCTEHSPKTNMTMEKQQFEDVSSKMVAFYCHIRLLEGISCLFSWPLLLYICKLCVWPPPRWGQSQHISAPSAWYIMIHDLIFCCCSTENRSQCFLGHVGDANRPAISLVKNSFQLLNSWS